ncbi:ribosome recycling factor [bacterium]|nr:ribosome recycling factor [bacterium]
MNADQITEDATQRMEKAIDVLKNGLGGVRTGRATPGLVDSLRVEVYGSLQPIKQIASVSVPEPSQLLIRPYDTSAIKDIEKAIVASDLGMAPQSDGRVVRLNVPPLSTEVRKKLVSRIKELAEESRVSIRNIRRDGNKAAETAEKEKTISEDTRDDIKDSIQELTKKYEEQVNELAKNKEKEVMED